METIDILESLQESIQTLRAISIQYRLAGGSSIVWRLVDHAAEHLDDQIKELLAPPDHRRDADCTLDPSTQACVICGVWHGAPCPDCGERGFHRNLCRQTRLIKQIHAL